MLDCRPSFCGYYLSVLALMKIEVIKINRNEKIHTTVSSVYVLFSDSREISPVILNIEKSQFLPLDCIIWVTTTKVCHAINGFLVFFIEIVERLVKRFCGWRPFGISCVPIYVFFSSIFSTRMKACLK